MSVKVAGIKELFDTLEKMDKKGATIGKNALNEAGEHVRKVEQQVAKRTHHEYSEDVGWKELKKYPIRTGKHGSRFVSVGIRAKATKKLKERDEANKKAGAYRPTYWDKVKGLWYNNYGFVHNKTGKYVAGSNWIDEAYEESIPGAYEKIKDEILKELNL